MPRPKAEKLMAKATRFMTEGYSQDKVAEMLGISTRTLQRWIAAGDVEVKPDLLDVAHEVVNEVLASESIKVQITNLLEYRDSQKFLALQMGSLATKLSKITLEAVQTLETNPTEVTPRLIPQYLRAVAELGKAASDCWARSVGLDDLIQKVDNDSEITQTRS